VPGGQLTCERGARTAWKWPIISRTFCRRSPGFFRFGSFSARLALATSGSDLGGRRRSGGVTPAGLPRSAWIILLYLCAEFRIAGFFLSFQWDGLAPAKRTCLRFFSAPGRGPRRRAGTNPLKPPSSRAGALWLCFGTDAQGFREVVKTSKAGEINTWRRSDSA